MNTRASAIGILVLVGIGAAWAGDREALPLIERVRDLETRVAELEHTTGASRSVRGMVLGAESLAALEAFARGVERVVDGGLPSASVERLMTPDQVVALREVVRRGRDGELGAEWLDHANGESSAWGIGDAFDRLPGHASIIGMSLSVAVRLRDISRDGGGDLDPLLMRAHQAVHDVAGGIRAAEWGRVRTSYEGLLKVVDEMDARREAQQMDREKGR